MSDQDRGKGVAIFVAEEAGKHIKRFRIRRQRMGLLVGHHLQAMLNPAQKKIRGGEFVARGSVDPTAGGEHGKHGNRVAAAQLAMPAAGDELLGLYEELDLADAAAAELDIMTLDRNL